MLMRRYFSSSEAQMKNIQKKDRKRYQKVQDCSIPTTH